jgi:hypothetical protein
LADIDSKTGIFFFDDCVLHGIATAEQEGGGTGRQGYLLL